MTREEARTRGLNRYFDGTPCKRGHVEERYTKNSDCLRCNRDRAAQWHVAHRPQVLERLKVLAVSNAEVHRARAKAWYAANPDRAREAAQKWRREHLEQHRASERARRLRHLEEDRLRLRGKEAKRRAQKRASPGSFTKEDLKRILRLQRSKCAYCRCHLSRYHVDHIQPLALGGSNLASNIQLLCRRCNLSKRASDPLDYARSHGLLL